MLHIKLKHILEFYKKMSNIIYPIQMEYFFEYIYITFGYVLGITYSTYATVWYNYYLEYTFFIECIPNV